MNFTLKTFAVILTSVLLSACADNVKRFKKYPDIKKSYGFKFIKLQSVAMPAGDITGVRCRLNGTIELPDKIKYSQYIGDSIQQSLSYINAKTNEESTHKLSVILTKVDVNTVKPKWYIDANVTVDNNAPVKLETATDHKSSWIAYFACKNAANSFDEALDNFIKQLFAHPQISAQLK